MPSWIRFRRAGTEAFGTLHDGRITVHRGDIFERAEPSAETVLLSEVIVLAPTRPSKIIALWNNFHALAAKLNLNPPEEPLYLLKAPSSALEPEGTARRPAGYDGRVVFEGELGIVIGRRCSNVSAAEAPGFIFGYTCVNDITASDIISKDPTFAQWARAKSFDGFGPFGPVIATEPPAGGASVRTILDGIERQNYPISDMVFPPAEIVARLSHDMTLEPGDLICCGTSVGVGTMKGPSNTVEIVIDGIGTLRNTYAG